jgi:hypothetical protein
MVSSYFAGDLNIAELQEADLQRRLSGATTTISTLEATQRQFRTLVASLQEVCTH